MGNSHVQIAYSIPLDAVFVGSVFAAKQWYYRFKGQAAPCVILTEVDFEEMDEITIRKLFVGATRATMKLVLVISDASANLLSGVSK